MRLLLYQIKIYFHGVTFSSKIKTAQTKLN